MRTNLRLFVLHALSMSLLTACGEDATAPTRTNVPVENFTPLTLPKTGQTICYDASGATIACVGTGQDGALLKGGTWAAPRFTDQSNGTLLDNNTGIFWAVDANAPGPAACLPAVMKNWQAALEYVKCLNISNHLGFSDWRLPNVRELASLVNTSLPDTSIWLMAQGFTTVHPSAYWSSTTAADNPSGAWGVGMDVGDVDGDDKSDSSAVWPVRSASAGSFDFVPPRTGQTLCYSPTGAVTACGGTAQDGDISTGATWPHTRFTDLTDGTMRDQLTGLHWSKDADSPGPAACSPAVTKNWQESLDYVTCLNVNGFLGYRDWRLPNRNELGSLVDYAQVNLAAWLADHGFSGIQAVYYWSSSTSADNPLDAWGTNMGDGDIDGDDKIYSHHAWPVRSGAEQ
jgi:hypothetical protein